ncbi:MAG: tRNA 2-thiouridine(34) synthase MnmA [Ruminococcaceae bacterium]|nr:tRNA 2-thiouridine(34) synthase MnmA [Oscillospiraceae bacterium]
MSKVCFVALSGGVDSAATAFVLKEQGYDVRGVTLRLKPGNLADNDIADAKAVADSLGIPFTVLDRREEFKKITDYFCNEYLMGRTPNPCVVCNPTIKFGELIKYTKENGGEFLATGHYAEIIEDENGIFHIKKAPSRKDQSYFLCKLNQDILKNVRFPLSSYTKEEVRELATKAGLDVAKKKDSQEVCFIPDDDYVSFIEKEKNPEAKFGDFISSTGEVLGEHKGIYKYTIGQRKGLGAFGKPMYVLNLNPQNNTVTVGDNVELFKDEISCSEVSFVSGILPECELKCAVKIRCAAKPAEAVLTMTGENTCKIKFAEPQRAAATGQTAVFYDGDILLGGGTIE